jgi:hypothetical protein
MWRWKRSASATLRPIACGITALSSTAGIASSRQIVSPQPTSPPRVVSSTIIRVTPVRTPEPQTIGLLTGIRTSQRRTEAIVRSLAFAETAKSGVSGRVLACMGRNVFDI